VKKILVIEDTQDVRNLIVDSLRKNGYTVAAVHNGIAGIEKAKTELPDLILCDVQMPGLDGYATLEALRKNPTTSAIPFIFLTGVTDKPHVRQGMELGADDYLTKPFTLAELMGAVRTQLAKLDTLNKRSDERLDELRHNISAVLPHELMTPLNGIIGFASVLAGDSGTFSPAEVREFAGHIQSAASRLQRLIENFLFFSQIELLEVQPERKAAVLRGNQPGPVWDQIDRVARRTALAANREQDLSVDLHETQLRVAPEHLSKIVHELLDNAFKFSEPGTPVQVKSELNGGHYVLQIIDHGRGFSSNEISRIGPHVQFGRKTFEQQGAGLGLIIVKRLVELHEAVFSIRSTPGVQTVVESRWPCSTAGF